MPLSIGIVGLPNVGKSSLFKILTKKQVEAANYPFCTIDPNVGVVKVPDQRLSKIAEISKPKQIIPTTIEFVDIAGLVAGAHQGEGLGNKFLANIRECNAICQIIRGFQDENVIHVNGKIDPQADKNTIDLELILADLANIEKKLEKTKKEAKNNDKELIKQVLILEKLKSFLDSEKSIRDLPLEKEEENFVKSLHLLSVKPVIYLLNTSSEKGEKAIILGKNDQILTINIKLEEEIISLPEKEQAEYIENLNLKQSGLDKLINAAYKILDLETFFTTGPVETRAWTVKSGTKAPEAAGVIHTDFMKGFIRAEVIRWEQLVNSGSESKAREQGLMRTEGKNYIIQDGDVCHFLIGK